MTDWSLNMRDAERRSFYDTLPEFAKGYLEAAFSMYIEYCNEKGDKEDVFCLGIDETPMLLLEGMVGDAIRFQIKNAEVLAIVCDGVSYTMTEAGRDFWFTCNSWGMGFEVRDLAPNLNGGLDALKYLTEVAKAMEAFPLDAEPLCDGADPLDKSQWVITSNRQFDAATPEQWAAVKGKIND